MYNFPRDYVGHHRDIQSTSKTLINPVAPAAQFAWAMLPLTDPNLNDCWITWMCNGPPGFSNVGYVVIRCLSLIKLLTRLSSATCGNFSRIGWKMV